MSCFLSPLLGCPPKTDMQSDKTSYSGCMSMFSILFAIVSAAILCTSCGGDNGKPLFKTSATAVDAYQTFLSEVKAKDNQSSSDFLTLVREWRTLDDSVAACVSRDTADVIHQNWGYAYQTIRNAVRQEVYRLTSSRPRSFSDVFSLKEIASPYCGDSELKIAAAASVPFFLSLDSIPYYKGSKENTLAAYRSLLDKTLQNGIHGRADLLAFIRLEDVLFRGFLTHLPELADANITDITKDTERCCRLAILSANQGKISHKDALVSLAMRTNRRVMLNARACLTDIDKNKVKTPDQARAYLWMLLQPYSAMDGFCVAVLSEKDKKELRSVADATPKAIGKLNKILQLDENRIMEMPALFMKVIISTM